MKGGERMRTGKDEKFSREKTDAKKQQINTILDNEPLESS
jgi:hypothetical protein